MTWHPDIPEAYRNQIVTGDARALAAQIPDESIDLIFTDPVYSEQPLYDALAAIALRVLKPGGAVLCWSNGKWHRQNANWLEVAGLTYRYDFTCVRPNSAAMYGKVVARANRLIWLDRDHKSKMKHAFIDGFISTQWSAMYSEWEWTKNPDFCQRAIVSFSLENTIVLDPYAGHATIPAVAKIAGRQYIGFEIDPTRAAAARTRLENTQAMHPLFVTDQAELDLSAA